MRHQVTGMIRFIIFRTSGGPADIFLVPLLASCPFDVLVVTFEMRNACERRKKKEKKKACMGPEC